MFGGRWICESVRMHGLVYHKFYPRYLFFRGFHLFLPSMQLEPTDASVLKIICQIVEEHSQPLKYQLHPRELILRSREDWNVIRSSLIVLENEGAIVTRRNLDNLQISLTAQGLKMCGTSKTV
jgi:hypothetical protein